MNDLQEQQLRKIRTQPGFIAALDQSGVASNERAIGEGLTFRPVGDTIRDTLAWATEEAGRRAMFQRTGLAPEKERAVLAAWRETR